MKTTCLFKILLLLSSFSLLLWLLLHSLLHPWPIPAKGSMESLDGSEPLASPLELIDHGEFQRVWESIRDSWDEDIPNPPPSFSNDEPVIAGCQLREQPELGNLSLVPSGPLDCSGCILLREVVHTNGLQNVKLAIHGGLGVFYHAILEITYVVDGLPPATEPSFIDLSAQTFEQIKKFLIDYGLLRRNNGYILIHDSLSAFYDTLCVRLNLDMASTSKSEAQLAEQGLCQSTPAVPVNDLIITEKTGLSAQRERTANLHIRDFADYFHLRMIDAAKEVGVCPTVLKKICRKHGMRRWPYRKVKSIDNMIKKLQDDLLAQGGRGAVSTKSEIEKLRAQRVRICGGLQPARL